MQYPDFNSKNENGFTLIELLIALAILVTGLLSVNFFLGNLVNKGGYLQNSTMATTLAAEKMEDLKRLALKLNTDTTPTYLSSTHDGTDTLGKDGGAGSVFSRAWTITGGPATTTVSVSVSWEHTGGTKTKTLTTIINQ